MSWALEGEAERNKEDVTGREEDKTEGLAAGMGVGDAGGSEKNI